MFGCEQLQLKYGWKKQTVGNDV